VKPISGFDRIGEENAFAVLARAGELAATGMDVINLGIGQPDFPTPENIVEAAVKALRDGQHGYTPATGLPKLREAVAADLHKRFDVEVSPARVLVVPGGKVTMFTAILMFGEPGVEIMYPDPGFPIYRSMIEYTGATPIPIPIREVNGFAFSADETLGLITDKTRLIILNSPANPCGGVTPKTEVDALVAGLENWPEIALLSDEIYDQMLYDGEAHVSLLSYPEIRNRLVNAWSCVNAPAQFAAIEALEGPQDAVSAMVKEFDARRELVVDLLNDLPGVSCIVPKGAFYAFPNISATGLPAKKLASDLLETTGVATIGGPDFGVLGEGYIRLSYANSQDNIKEALSRIKSFLER